MLTAHMVERAKDSTLQERKEALNRVCVDVAANVLPSRVIDRMVSTVERLADSGIGMPLVREDFGLLINVVEDRLLEGRGVGRVNGERANIAVTLNQGHYRGLLGRSLTRSNLNVHILLLAADVGFVHFDDAGEFGLNDFAVHRV